MDDSITIETDMFEHREVKPHFINPCCFGEDFAAWLKQQLSPLTDSGFVLSEPIQEDYGWGFWASRGKDPFWLSPFLRRQRTARSPSPVGHLGQLRP